MFKHILVPLDGSTRAEAALPLATRLARATGSSVALLQVVSMPMDYGYGLEATPMISEVACETEETEAKAYLTHIASSDQFAGISTTTDVVFGSPAPQILDLVEQQAMNLIVLCSHGRTGLTRWALGSVAQRVIHHSDIPVLVLRDGEASLPALHSDTARPPCAVVAMDGSSLAETALLPAAHLVSALSPQHTQGVIHLLHVAKPSTLAADEDLISQRSREDMAQVYLQHVRERLLDQTNDLNLQVTWSVTSGQDVAETIVTSAEQGTESMGVKRGDLLAMATHGRGGIERWIMGSVTERVLEASTVPILVVRPFQATLDTEETFRTSALEESRAIIS